MTDIDDEPFESVPEGKKENQFFIVCNKSNVERQRMGKKNVYWDDCGAWDSKSTKVSTEKFLCSSDKKLTKVVYMQGELCTERTKNGNRVYLPICPQPDPSTLLVLHRNYSKHSMAQSYRRKVTWLESNGKDFPKIACYEYLGKFPGHHPHGSCKKNYRNYIRAKESTLAENIQTDVRDAYQDTDEEVLCSTDSYQLSEKVFGHDNEKSFQSKYSRSEIKVSKSTSDTIFDQIHTHPFVQMATACKGKQTSFILYIKEQILDIKRFCCHTGQSETTVLCFSKIDNFCRSTLTFSIFKNLAFFKSKQNPLFVGPMYLHENADYFSYITFFAHLASEIGESHSQLIIKSEGKEMCKAFSCVFPNGYDVSFVHHMQKDLLSYLKKQRGIQPKMKNALKVLLFGENGIITCKDSVTFTHLLNKAQKLCNEIAPSIGMYFNTNIAPQLRKNFVSLQKLNIPSTGSKWTSSLCNNFKPVLKKFNSASSQMEYLELVEKLHAQVAGHYKEVERCLIGHGSFSLAPEFVDFSVNLDLWIGMGESDRNEHIHKFLHEVKRKGSM